jgi:hypothetical protein
MEVMTGTELGQKDRKCSAQETLVKILASGKGEFLDKIFDGAPRECARLPDTVTRLEELHSPRGADKCKWSLARAEFREYVEGGMRQALIFDNAVGGWAEERLQNELPVLVGGHFLPLKQSQVCLHHDNALSCVRR